MVKDINTITLANTTYQNKFVLEGVNLANVPWANNSMVNAFNNCANLQYVTNINENVTNMAQTFSLCHKLEEVETIPSNVTNMFSCFDHCSSLVDSPDIPNSVNDLRYAYFYCKKLINSPDISNLTNVSSLESTFSTCIELENVSPIPNSSADLIHTFSQCYNLVDAPDMSNANSVTNMYETFSFCNKLENVSLPNNVISLYRTFINCDSLVNAPSIPSSTTNMYGTFENCIQLYNVNPIPNSVTNLSQTFYRCMNLQNTPDLTNANSVTNMYGTFYYCNKMTTPSVIPNNVNNIGLAFTYCSNLQNAPIIPDSVVNMSHTFAACKNIFNAPVIPDSVEDLQGCFAECEKLNNVPEFPKYIKNMAGTFRFCSNLAGDIFIWSNVINDATLSFGNTEAIKNVFIPFTIDGYNTTTYTAFQQAGYSSTTRKDGVLLFDINGWRYTFDEEDRQILQEYLGSSNIIEPLPGDNVYFGDCTSSEFVNARDANSPFYNNQNVVVAELRNHQWVNNSMAYAFYNDSNVEYIRGIPETIVNYHKAFYGCTNIKEIEFPYTYYEADISEAFSGCTGITITVQTPPPGVIIQASESMAGAFQDTGIQNPPAVAPGVRNVSHTYKNTQVNTVELPNTVTNMSHTYAQTPIQNVVSMPAEADDLSWAFAWCYQLDGVANFPMRVTNMQGTFYDDYRMTSYADIQSQYLTDISMCFYNCQSLTSFGRLGSTAITNMYQTFYNCTNLVTSPMIPANVTTVYGLYDGCTKLKGDLYIRSQKITDATDFLNNTNASLTKNICIPFNATSEMTYTKGYCWEAQDGTTFYTKSDFVNMPKPEGMVVYYNGVCDNTFVKMNDIDFRYDFHDEKYYVNYYNAEFGSWMNNIECSYNAENNIILTKQIGDTSPTYDSFIEEGYSPDEVINGVKMVDVGEADSDFPDWNYTIDDFDNVKLYGYIGADATHIVVPSSSI